MDAILKKLTKIENLLVQQDDRPLTFNEAANYLDVSRSYLYKLTWYNKIHHYKPSGKRVYFDRAELKAWFLRRPVKTNQAIESEADDYVNRG